MAEWFNENTPLMGLNHILPFSLESLGVPLFSVGVGASNTWQAANTAIYVPFRITSTVKLAKAFTSNGATATGNIDVGVYDRVGTRLASTGSTAQSGTSTTQTMTLSVTLAPGQYWIALAASSTSTTFYMTSSTYALPMKILGMREQASAFPLPATATMVAISAITKIPYFGVTSRSVV